jgi:hypothetical protein
MLLTIVVMWAIVLPLAILAITWQAAKLRNERVARMAGRSVPQLGRASSRAGDVPACAVRAARPRRTITRRVCPERPHGAGRRSAST